MAKFQYLLAGSWVLLTTITIVAFLQLGLEGMLVVLGDLGNFWRLQIYTDFILHGLIIVCWILYREESRRTGVICSLLVMTLGGLFTFVYILVTTYRCNGDFVYFLTGRRQTVT